MSKSGHKHRHMSNRTLAKRTVPPGSSTLVLQPPSHAHTTSLSIMRYNKEVFVELLNATLEDVRQVMAHPDDHVWIHVAGLADVETIRQLAAIFTLHSLILDDIVNSTNRPKAEHFDDTLLVITRLAPQHVGDSFDQFALVLKANILISFDENRGDCFDPVRKRLREGGRLRLGPVDHLLAALLDAAVDAWFPVLEHEGELLDQLEDRIANKHASSTLEWAHMIKRRLLSYRRVVWPLREVLGSLLRESDDHIEASTKPYLRDTYDHVVELVDLIELFRETSVSISELHLALVSARMNDVMKFLTIISTIFMPITFIVGVYGMNFTYMPELHWHYGYFYAWGLMALIVASLLAYFYRRGLLGTSSADLTITQPDDGH